MESDLPREIDPSNQLAYGVRTLARLLDVGHDSIYAALRDGRLRAKRYGKRTLIPADSVKHFLDNLPDANFQGGSA
jgi:excisionase family DNA binding protein